LAYTANGGRDYFAPAFRALSDAGFSARVVESRMELSPEEKIEALAQNVRDAPGRVLLIGHSAGGLDALEVLRQSGVSGRVLAVATIQTPYCGAEQADRILSGSGSLLERLAMLFGGRMAQRAIPHLQRVSVAERKEKYCGRSARFPSIPRGVKLFSVASYGAPEEESRSGEWHDGRVELQSQLVPGARAVILQGARHGDLVRDSPLHHVTPGRPPDVPIRFINALVSMMLEDS